METAVTIAVDRAPGEVRAAALGPDGALLDLAIERPGTVQVGDLFRGRVTARVPAMAGAFVALPEGPGFLPDSAGGRGVGDGDFLAVRVVRAPLGAKGPRLQAEPCDAASGPPSLLAAGPGAVARLLALYPGAAMVRWHESVEDQVAGLAEMTAPLPGGGRLTVSPTPALTALDVDLAAAAASRSGKNAAHMAGNAGFLPEIARQIRLRELGGAIVLDLAGLSVRRRAALGEAIAASLAADPRGPRFLGFTALGLAEILRRPVYAPLHEMLAGPHHAALAAARSWARDVAATPTRRLALRAALPVAHAWAGDSALRLDMRAALGEPAAIRADATLPGFSWRLEAM